jgi:proline dehydrogenase
LNALILTLLLLPAGDPPSLDALVDRVVDIRKQQAELAKEEAATLAEVRARLKALEERLGKIDPKPVPPPVPPKPADPLAVALRAAFLADTGATKADQLLTLAELYKQAGDLAGLEAVTTTGQLMERIRQAAAALKIDGLLPCRKLIAAECATALGTDPDGAMTAATREKAKALFLRVHEALKGANGG